MRKTIFKVVIIIAVTLLILIGIMYLIDWNRMKKGKEVVFCTWGEKLETIKTVNITYNSIPDFEILFYAKDSTESYKVYTILDKSETDKYDYNIYGYNGIVNIKIDGNEYSLKEALLENKITMEEIIGKANKDEKDGKITAEMYKDGGSMEYYYDNYTIIKFATLSGNRDVYIGTKGLRLTDIP